MTILAIGTAPGDFDSADAKNAGVLLYEGTIRLGPNGKAGIMLNGLSTGFNIALSEPVTELWFTAWFASYRVDASAFWKLVDADGITVFQFESDLKDRVDFEVWNGSAFQELVSDVPFPWDAEVFRFDVRFKLDAVDGVVELYVNGELTGSFAGNTNPRGAASIASLRLLPATSSTNYVSYYSQILVSTESTLGKEVIAHFPNGAGTFADQVAGGVAEIDEVGMNDADFLRLAAAGDCASFATTPLPAAFANGWDVVAVVSNVRVQMAETSPVDLVEPLVVSGGVAAIGDPRPLSLAPRAKFAAFEMDPATGQPWTIAAASAAEVGLRTAASE